VIIIGLAVFLTSRSCAESIEIVAQASSIDIPTDLAGTSFNLRLKSGGSPR
jgi:hypothetical protein